MDIVECKRDIGLGTFHHVFRTITIFTLGFLILLSFHYILNNLLTKPSGTPISQATDWSLP